MKTAGSGQRGFTLLEMLAAIMLLAIGSTVLLGAFGQSARSLRHTEQSDRVAFAARSLMDEADNRPLSAGTQRGTWSGLDWVLDVTREPPSGALMLYRLELTVSEEDREWHFQTLRLRTAEGLR